MRIRGANSYLPTPIGRAAAARRRSIFSHRPTPPSARKPPGRGPRAGPRATVQRPRGRAGDHPAAADDGEPRRAQPHGLDRIGRLQQHHVGVGSDCEPVALQPQDAGGDFGHGVETSSGSPRGWSSARRGRPCARRRACRRRRARTRGPCTQSWPSATGMPSARISAMRVRPRRRG